MKVGMGCALCLGALVLAPAAARAQTPVASHEQTPAADRPAVSGAEVYRKSCAACHEQAEGRTPSNRGQDAARRVAGGALKQRPFPLDAGDAC